MQLGSWQFFSNFSDEKLSNSGLQSAQNLPFSRHCHYLIGIIGAPRHRHHKHQHKHQDKRHLPTVSLSNSSSSSSAFPISYHFEKVKFARFKNKTKNSRSETTYRGIVKVREYIQTYCLTRSHMFSTYVDLQTIFISEVILTLVALESLLGGECVAISRRMQISAKYRLSPL